MNVKIIEVTMNMKIKWIAGFLLITLMTAFVPWNGVSQKITKAGNVDVEFPEIGTIQPRHANDIKASPWSVGAETMDRDYIIYNKWRDYLGPLGVKKARIQSGWAKTEKQKGVYNWAWMDEIIPDMVSQGVEPWVSLSYGNTIYEGGGGTTLADKDLPETKEALDAWARYVKAVVARYKDYVDEWEVWNEPNYDIDPEQYAEFLIITANAVKEIQPESTIIGIALGSRVNYEYADDVLGFVEEKGAIDLIDQIAYHRHISIPEENQPEIELEKVLDKYGTHLVARQGEAGCPSEYSEDFAMSGREWSELTQAKHVLRRMMTDFGREKESSVFIIMDAKYTRQGEIVWNRKGLLKSNDDQSVQKKKDAYYAVQHVTSIFDSSLQVLSNFPVTAKTDRSLSFYGIEDKISGENITAIWFDDEIPSEKNEFKKVDFAFSNANFRNPVYVDLRTGRVYEIPEKNWSRKGTHYQFVNIPVYDSPILIAEKSLLSIQV